jgi:hypothetical protein
MREVVFALEFRGTAGPVPGAEHLREARSTAPSQTLSTVLSKDGVHARVEAAAGDTAVLESRVERFGDGSFVESGTITYGAAGSIVFETIGRGWVSPAPDGSGVVGGVLWRIREATGRLTGVQGLISSNFTVTLTGEVTDNQFARLYVPLDA